jgi:CSLREA domain-containing protein
MKHIGLWSFVLVFILISCGRSPAPQGEPTLDTQAATINVNTTVDEWDFPIANNKCSLREAIISANDNSDFGGCTHSGSYGGDTINLPAGTYRLTRGWSFGLSNQDWGDLNVRSPIDLRGSGASTTTIEADFSFTDGFSRVLNVDQDVFFAIRRVKITGGNTTRPGGGLLIRDGNIVEDVIVEGNSASFGGGIYSCNGFIMRRTTIRGNTSTDRGGGIGMDCSGTSNFIIDNSTISGNIAATRGGGIALRDGTFIITNSTFSGNFASDRGGAIRADGGTVNLLNVTITANSAGNRQGGIARAGGTFILGNTIVAGNIAPNHPDCEGSFGSTGNNLIGIVDSGCTGFSSLLADITGSTTSPRNPQLGLLADNGGTTRTHALLPGSPALDVASPSLCPSTDQRGTVRPLDGNNDSFTICDIGAFELANPARADLSISLSDSVDPVVISNDYSYTATVTNLGPDRSANTRIEFTIPTAATILTLPSGSGCTRSGNVITCSVGFVNNGASVSRTINVRAPATLPTNGNYTARARARSATPEPSPSDIANSIDYEQQT